MKSKIKIIAELCQNHGGDFDRVKEMVDVASANGATHVKIQNIYARNLVFRPEFESVDNLNLEIPRFHRPFKQEYDRLRGLELKKDECKEFVKYCKQKNVVPLTTCFSRDTIDEIKEQGFEEVKVASYDCASFQLLKELASKFSYVYVSTGATFDDEILKAARVFSKMNFKDFSFLHCVTKYPTPNSMMNIARIDFLKQFTSDVGFSDHSNPDESGLDAAKYAFTRGATILERHFTILSSDATKDGPVSMSGKDLKELSEFANNSSLWESFKKNIGDLAHVLEGNEKRNLTTEELTNRRYYRGRFASPRFNSNDEAQMIFNWEETPI